MQIQKSGDVPLPRIEDPFHDDLGYGVAIHVVSTNIHHRLTWRILGGSMQGLWDILVEGNRYKVCERPRTCILIGPVMWFSDTI